MSVLGLIGGFIAANGGPVAVAVVGAQIVGRAIPDNKRGVLGVIRKIAKTVGMYYTPDLTRVEQNVEGSAVEIAKAVVVTRGLEEAVRAVKAGNRKKPQPPATPTDR